LKSKTGAVLIALQIALSLAIVSNALFIVHDRLALSARPSGIDDEGLLFGVGLAQIKDPPDIFAMQKRDEQAIRAIPGVSAVTWVNQTPLSQSGWNMSLATDRKHTESLTSAAYYMTPGPLIATLGLKLIAGSDFTAADIEEVDPKTSRSVGHSAIISRPLAERLYPGAASVIGKPVLIGTGDTAGELRIIGVVETLQTPWAQATEQSEFSLIAGVRYGQGYSLYAVRAEPGQLDQVMRDVEATLIKSEPGRIDVKSRTALEVRERRYRDDKAVAWLLVTVTGLLLLVTASGIVGMASLWVNQRRKQIGVRRALGARRVDILRYFLLENALITTLGVIVGLGLALALNQLLMGSIEMPRLPVGYFVIGMAVMWALGLVAVIGPALRATRVAPAIATRSA
jgi:putative ABC transport system permease protein